MDLTKILACPRCKTPLDKVKNRGLCKKCGFEYKYLNGIWHLLNLSRKSNLSKKGYEKLHKRKSARVDDGSYEIFAAFARGNKTIDIACGDGFIEKLAPETVGVDFSLNSLKKASKSGVKNLVLADAHALPFKDKSFDLSICAGSLEHFANPQKALKEMARVSKIQILTVHKKLPIPGFNFLRSLVLSLKSIPDQPIDNPLSWSELSDMLKKSGMNVIFKGVWTHPYDFQVAGLKVPKFLKIPSCHFIISTSSSQVSL